MISIGCRGMTLLAVVALAALVSAQVTFSRDWSGGKRAAPADFDCGQFARLCRQFMHELQQAMSSERLVKHRRPEPDDSPLVYDEK